MHCSMLQQLSVQQEYLHLELCFTLLDVFHACSVFNLLELVYLERAGTQAAHAIA